MFEVERKAILSGEVASTDFVMQRRNMSVRLSSDPLAGSTSLCGINVMKPSMPAPYGRQRLIDWRPVADRVAR